MSLVLLWRAPARLVETRWRGPAGLIAAIEREPLAPVAAVIGPPGAASADAAPVRIDAALGDTWVLPHTLGRVPLVEVSLVSGERVMADVNADETAITVSFSAPQSGFVLAF